MFRALRSTSKTALLLLVSLIVLSLAFCMAGGKSYAEGTDDYQFGTAEVWSTFNGELLDDSYYYSDSWFTQDPETENDMLALLSMQVTASVISDEEDSAGADFLKKLGFTDIGFYGFRTENIEDCAYMWGSKKVGSETVIAVVFQSYSTVDSIKLKGWKQNFIVNGENAEGEHYAFGKASDTVLGDIAALSGSIDGNVRYWITGHSRGGAIANLISAKLPAKLAEQGRNGKIYAYTFEAPSTIDNDAIDDPEKYGYIHNFRCSDDIVTMVPPAAWGNGMTLYGVSHKLNTEETDANLNAELKKLGSKAQLEEDSSLGDNTADSIIAALVSRIPQRADYSVQNSESFTLPDGQQKTIDYSYQGTFVRLIEIIFGENKINTAGLSDRLSEAVPALDSYIRAYLTECGKLEGTESDARALYFDAAEKLCAFLRPEEGELPFNEEEAYALLELAAPVLINPELADNTDYAVTDDPMTQDLAFAYLSPGLTIAMGSGKLTLSHHFDTSIARLKTLAPQPETEGIAVTVPDPKSGDAVSKVTRDTEKAVDDMSISWLDASAKWKTDDPKIKKNKVYYLELSFYVKGHSIPENAKFTVNGKEPCAEPKISYKDGIAIIRCAYRFTFGTPKEYRVTFDTEYGESPEEMTVTEGTILRYVQQPLMEDIEGYHFGGWRTYSNDEWDSIEISDETTEWGEITFCAMWVEYIDDIQISFSIPAVGQTWEMPSIAKNANYHLEETAVQNSNYDRIEKITGKETLTLSFKVVPNSKAYALSTGDNKYRGTLTVKGVSVDYSYTDFEDNLNVSCIFTPLDNNVTALQKGGSFEMADKVIRSSKSDKSLNGSSRSPLKLRVSKKTKKSLKLTWKKADGAKTYVIYGARKGKKMTKIATVKKNSYNVKKIGKKLSKGKKYKFIVVARDGNEVVSTSATVLAKTKK